MPTRHPLLIRRLLLQILSLMSKVCFGGFVVRIEQMFLCRCSFTGRLCGLAVQWLPVVSYLCSTRLAEALSFPFFF